MSQNVSLQLLRSAGMIVGLTAMLLLAAVWTATPLHAQDDPDFGAINDPLVGEYQLFDVSDLLIGRTKPLSSDTESEITNYILETADRTISSQSKEVVARVPCYLPDETQQGEPLRQPQRTRIGRFFALGYDVIVTLAPSAAAEGDACATTDSEDNMALYIQDTNAGTSAETTVSMSAYNTALAVDDFNQDGYDDLLIMNDDEFFVATATDVTDISQGFTFGPRTSIRYSQLYIYIQSDPATGDFNGDGLTDVAWVAEGFANFATVCPTAVADTVCDGKDPLTVVQGPLESGKVGILLDDDDDIYCSATETANFALTAGDFGGAGDGLLTVNVMVPEGESGATRNCEYVATWYQFDENFTLTNGAYVDRIVLEKEVDPYVLINIFAAADRLDWFGTIDQAVVAWGGIQRVSATDALYSEGVHVLSFGDEKMTVTTRTADSSIKCEAAATGSGGYGKCVWINGMAVGHFEDVTDSGTEQDFDLQIATLRNDGTVTIYGVEDPPTFTLTVASQTQVRAEFELNESSGELDGPTWLVAGDLQGRSARLGGPSIVRIQNHSQPAVILGAPPMHVDYVLPDESTSADADVINFTTAPSSFFSKYTVSDTSTTQSSNTNTASYSYAYSESVQESFRFQVPVISEIDGTTKQAWKQTGDSTVSQNSFTQDEYAFNADTTTGFGDVLWFSTVDFNVYYYPVLGQTVTVTEDGQSVEQPLYVAFSGPSNEGGITPAQGATVEWYQPVHQPGQVFSYPWDLTQLDARFDGVDALTSKSIQGFLTDDSETTESLSWTQSDGSSQTAGSTHTHSFDTDNSGSLGFIPFEGGQGATLSGSFDYNNSTSVGSLYQSTTSVGASSGIAIAKPSFDDSDLYGYLVRPFVFGQTPAIETAQELEPDTEIKTSGPLTTAYVADPTFADAGSWWTSSASAYTQDVDIALNHPLRWNMATSGTGLACIDEDQTFIDCAIPFTPQPDDVWNSQFYHMRGFFITVGGASGPLRSSAKVGETVYLQARVYNYSLKDMPADSEIHVRFYRQEISGTVPISPSVLIDEVTAGPLAAFNSSANLGVANWTTVETDFTATDDMADKYYIFWVVAWAEDSAGALLDEVAAHGLTELPGTLSGIGDAPLETVSVTTAAEETIDTSFTNNVGMFKQMLYITEATGEATDSLADDAAGSLTVSEGAVERAFKFSHGIHVVRAKVRATGGDVSGIELLYYDGDPSAPGTILHDVDHLPYLAADKRHSISIPFRPTACGSNEVVLVARSGAANSSSITVPYDVPCSSVYFPIVSQMEPAE